MLETKQKSFRPVNKSEQESRTPGTRKYRKMEVRSTWKGHATSEGGEDGNPGGLYKEGVDMRILADQPGRWLGDRRDRRVLRFAL